MCTSINVNKLLFIQEDPPRVVRCLCGELNPTQSHFASCHYCTVCGRWAHGRAVHNRTCQTSNPEENPKKKCCPYCNDWIFKSSFARHVKNRHPDKYLRKSFAKATPTDRPTRRRSELDDVRPVKKESPDVKPDPKPAKVTSKKKEGVRDQKPTSKTSPAATKSPGVSPKLPRKRPSSKTSPAADSHKKSKLSVTVPSPSGTGQPNSLPSTSTAARGSPGAQNFFTGASRTAVRFMLGVVADPVADAKYRLRSIDRNDKTRC